MPIYEYRCAACGFQEEHLQKVSEPPLTVCPSCGKPKFAKLLSAAGFQLKGSGWYATDFKGGAKPAKDKADAKPEAKNEAKSEPKAETKSESKQESNSGAKSVAAPASAAD
jgi:putative FmdB family regulatory protein